MNAKSELPAILGGQPSCAKDITGATKWPLLDAGDLAAIQRILEDGDISTHPVIGELEADYRGFTGRSYALAHCNGTAALLAAFWAIGLKPGDEVLVPSATFWASVSPMLWVGAVPVFCESETERMGLDPEDLRRKITPRTKAIVVVHLWGMPSRMTEIRAVAKEYGLKIIEDASHAQGASWRGMPCGTLGDVSVFSLQGNKLAPAGEGGILLCDSKEYWERAVCLGDITKIIQLDSPNRRFAATSYGVKTRIAPVSAAIARVQLSRLIGALASRAEALEYLSHGLEKLGFETFLPPPHVQRVYFEYLVRPRPAEWPLSLEATLEALRAEGCVADRPRYPLLHQQPFFTEGAYLEIARLPSGTQPPDYSKVLLPVTEKVNSEMIKLPTFQKFDKEILDAYIEALAKIKKHSSQIASRPAA